MMTQTITQTITRTILVAATTLSLAALLSLAEPAQAATQPHGAGIQRTAAESSAAPAPKKHHKKRAKKTRRHSKSHKAKPAEQQKS